jgi:hypothetical protein
MTLRSAFLLMKTGTKVSHHPSSNSVSSPSVKTAETDAVSCLNVHIVGVVDIIYVEGRREKHKEHEAHVRRLGYSPTNNDFQIGQTITNMRGLHDWGQSILSREEMMIRQCAVYACRSVNMHVSMPTLRSNILNSSRTRYPRTSLCSVPWLYAQQVVNTLT